MDCISFSVNPFAAKFTCFSVTSELSLYSVITDYPTNWDGNKFLGTGDGGRVQVKLDGDGQGRNESCSDRWAWM